MASKPLILLAALPLAVAAQNVPQSAAAPTYAESLRCAGLSEGAANLAGRDNAEWRKLYDSAVYWGMVASQAAQREGVAAERFKIDQKLQRDLTGAELGAKDAKTTAELDACLKRAAPQH
jgi:hypothetical protein